MTGWQVAPFVVRHSGGETTVAGWVNEPFAIDFRAIDASDYFADEDEWVGGWAVTHLPSGHLVRRIQGALNDVQEFVDSLRVADWSFTDPAECKPLGVLVKASMDAFPTLSYFGRCPEIGPIPLSPPAA